MEKLAAKGKLTAKNADLHWLYEQSVQNADVEVEFIDRVFRKEFGRKPTFLREDFCGTALLCADWVKPTRGQHRPGRGPGRADPGLGPGQQPRSPGRPRPAR